MLLNNRLFTSLIIFIGMSLLIACTDDEETGPPPVITTYQGSANINPANFPAGVGLDLSAADTGRVAQLDTEASLQWDISILTIRTGAGGRPGIFLFGDTETAGAVKALNVSVSDQAGTGATSFENFGAVSNAMKAALQADGVYAFDPQVDKDEDGKPDADRLAEEYLKLVIGDKGIRDPEADQAIYLVQDRNGDFYKFQFVMLENGGNITLRWAKFDEAFIE